METHHITAARPVVTKTGLKSMDRKRAFLSIACAVGLGAAAAARASEPIGDFASAAAFESLAVAEPSAGGDPRAWRAALPAQAGQRHLLQPGLDLVFSGDAQRLVAWLRVAGPVARQGVVFSVPGATGFASSLQGHARLTVPDGDLALLRPGAVVDDGAALQPVAAHWADAGSGRARLVFPEFSGKLPVLVRFETLFLADPATLARHDRDGNGRVDLNELTPALPAPLGGASVTASKTDTLVTDTGTIGQANPGDVIAYETTVTAQGDTVTAMEYIDAPDSDTTLVAGSLNVSPLALDDTYAAVGNVTLDVNTAPAGIFGNDREFPVGALNTFTLATAGPNGGSQAACGSFPCVVTTAQGGTVTLKAPGDGRFTYSSPPALAIPGTDSFVYVITDGQLTSTGTVTFNVDGRVWFVDRDDAGPPFLGTQADPFNLLAAVNGAGGLGDPDGPNDIIYLHDRAAAVDYVAGIELEPGQRLVGSGVDLIVGGNVILAATTPPVVEHAGGNAITLIAGVVPDGRPHIEGLHVNAAANAAIAGTGVGGTVDIDQVTINTSGSAAGLSLTNHSGSLTFDGTIGGSGTGAAVVLSGGNGNVALGGATISKTAGRVVDVQSKTGGTINFGAVTGTGAATDAIVAQNNTGTTLNFGSGFAVTTTAGRGLFASSGGTITVGGTATINATGGAALDVSGTSFGAGATLASASSTSSSAEGIRLVNVSGPLTINGGAISGSAGTAFSLAQGSSVVAYAGTISKTNAGRAVDVQTRAGGTATLSGAITATGASTGINVSGATGAATVTFTGAVDLGTGGTPLTGGTALTVNHGATGSTTTFADLDVVTTGQEGISASNGGTLNITTGSVNAGRRALNLDGLALGATLTTVSSTGSTAEGVRLNAATGTLTVGATTVTNPGTQGIVVQGSSATVDFASSGSTTISGTGTQRILVTTTTGNVDFGNTTVSGGTDGVSLQNNSAGTRTFGTLGVSGNTGIGFLHAVSGGAVNVTGATTITNPGGTGVDIQSSNSTVTFNGVTVNKGASAGTGVSLASNPVSPTFGALAITTSNGTGLAVNLSGVNTTGGSIAATSGPAINATSGTFSATFATVSSTNSASQGINLASSSGTLTMSGGAISGSAGTAFNVAGGNATATYGGTVTQNNAQRAVDVQTTTGGGISISTVSAGASSTGVNINAANGNVTFTNLTHGTSGSRTANQAVTINGGTGTYGLGTVSIFTTGGTAKGISSLNADGTLNSTAGTVDAAGAPAIDIDGPAGLTTLGMTLTTVAANGGSNGMLVRDTNGSFSVVGSGGAGTGGTVQGMTARGARFAAATGISLAWMNFTGNGSNQDVAATCGDALNGTNTNCGAGIDLQGVSGVTLDRLALSGGTQMGLNGNDVTNLTITNSSVQNVGNENLEDGVQFVNLKGTCAITDTNFSGNYHRQLEIQNSSGTLTNLTLTRVTLDRGTYVSTAAQGLLVAGQNTAAMTVTIRDSDFARNFGSGFFGQSINSGNVTMVIGDVAVPANGNTFTNNSLSVQMVADSGSTQTATVANNLSTVSATVTSGSTPFSFRKSLSATGLYTGTVTANQIGDGTAQSGNNCAGCNGLTIQNEGASGAMRMTVTNNTIQHINQRGIEALLQLNDTMGIVLTGNLIQSPDGAVGQAVFGQSGNDATDTGTLCMDITGNTVGGLWDTGVIPTGRNMRLRQAPAGGTTAFRLRNIGGTTATDANNFLNANNTNALAGCSAGTGFTTGAAACF